MSPNRPALSDEEVAFLTRLANGNALAQHLRRERLNRERRERQRPPRRPPSGDGSDNGSDGGSGSR